MFLAVHSLANRSIAIQKYGRGSEAWYLRDQSFFIDGTVPIIKTERHAKASKHASQCHCVIVILVIKTKPQAPSPSVGNPDTNTQVLLAEVAGGQIPRAGPTGAYLVRAKACEELRLCICSTTGHARATPGAFASVTSRYATGLPARLCPAEDLPTARAALCVFEKAFVAQVASARCLVTFVDHDPTTEAAACYYFRQQLLRGAAGVLVLRHLGRHHQRSEIRSAQSLKVLEADLRAACRY